MMWIYGFAVIGVLAVAFGIFSFVCFLLTISKNGWNL